MTEVRRGFDWMLLAMWLALALIAAGAVRLATQPAMAEPTLSVLTEDAPSLADEPPPIVEPLELKAVSRDEAVVVNAAVPILPGAPPAARAFRFTGAEADRTRAIACLAATAWYEAGDDETGQRSVMQVVLNRVRHPAYPRSVCAVVFQGAERTTGCQFSYTCDGSLRRRPSDAAWTRARTRAAVMLDGSVFKPVGWATHYHTDWVLPYWSASLDKIAKVHTHLFFRWRGGWGRGGAFVQRPLGTEPVVARIAWLSDVHRQAVRTVNAVDPTIPVPDMQADRVQLTIKPAEAPQSAAGPVALPKGMRVTGQSATGAVLVTTVPAKSFPGDHALDALRLCRSRNRCTVVGWAPGVAHPAPDDVPAIAASNPLFVFVQDKRQRRQTSLWDCRRITRPNPDQCLPTRTDRLAALLQSPAPRATAASLTAPQ